MSKMEPAFRCLRPVHPLRMHDGPLGAKAVGILFGGVTDENKSSRFGEGTEIPRCPPMMQPAANGPVPEAVDADVPLLTFPPPRYNAILAVLRNALYMFAVFFFWWDR